MWRDAYLESRVLAASPIELIRILYERALELIQGARRSLAAGDIAARSKAISGTIAILAELDCSLDHQTETSISANLSGLYQYMTNRLSEANLKQEDAPLAEVESLVKTLGEAWMAIGPNTNADPAFETTHLPGETETDQTSALFRPELELQPTAHSWSA